MLEKLENRNATILSFSIPLPYYVSGTVQSMVSKTKETCPQGSQSPQLQKSKRSNNKQPCTLWPQLSSVYIVVVSDPQERREGRRERKQWQSEVPSTQSGSLHHTSLHSRIDQVRCYSFFLKPSDSQSINIIKCHSVFKIWINCIIMNVYFYSLHFRTTLYSLRTCVDTFNMFLILSACTLSPAHHNIPISPPMCIQVTSSDLSRCFMKVPLRPSAYLCSAQGSIERCAHSQFHQKLFNGSPKYMSFLTSSQNLDVIRGFVFPSLGGKVNSDIDSVCLS